MRNQNVHSQSPTQNKSEDEKKNVQQKADIDVVFFRSHNRLTVQSEAFNTK